MNNDLAETLRRLTKVNEFQLGFVAIVREYQDELTCIVEKINNPDFDENKSNKDNFIYDVHITALESDIYHMVYIKPAIGSLVIVSRYDQNMKFISVFTKVNIVSFGFENNGLFQVKDTDNTVQFNLDSQAKEANLGADNIKIDSKTTEIDGSDNIILHGGKIQIGNDSVNLLNILTAIIDTLTNNVSADLIALIGYGASHGATLVTDLTKIKTDLSKLLN